MRIEIKKPKDSLEMIHIYLTKKDIKNLLKRTTHGGIIKKALLPSSLLGYLTFVIQRDNKKEEKK